MAAGTEYHGQDQREETAGQEGIEVQRADEDSEENAGQCCCHHHGKPNACAAFDVLEVLFGLADCLHPPATEYGRHVPDEADHHACNKGQKYGEPVDLGNV
ncbi:hypothetical protein D3C73_1278410 [compost metagenome]